MKEIKFRAWVVPLNSNETRVDMVDVAFAEFPTGKITTTDGWRFDNDMYQISLMQYTGLKDKNGKEIYEGDVLKHKYFYSPEFSLEQWEQEEQITVKLPDFFCYLGSDLVQNSDETMEEFVGHMEVIGNIWEHPNKKYN